MQFDIEKTLHSLCRTRDRAEVIQHTLSELNIPYRVEDYPGLGKRNLIVDWGYNSSEYKHVYGAHYDAVDCPGANDNGAALLVLVQLALRLNAAGAKLPVSIVFWDAEEPGHHFSKNGIFSPGSYLFAKELEYAENQPDLVYVLDVVGFGDRLVYNAPYAPRTDHMVDALKEVYPELEEISTPPSDEHLMQRAGIDAILLSVLPEDEIWGFKTTWGFLHTDFDNEDTVDPDTIPWLAEILYNTCLPLMGRAPQIVESKSPSDEERRRDALDKLLDYLE